MLRLPYQNFEFLRSNVILGKIELLLPTPVLLLPGVAYRPIKSIDFSYQYFWIQVSLQLSTNLGAEGFSRKKFAKFLAQTFANDKMTRISRGENFGEVEIYIQGLINYSTRKLLQKLENYSFWSIVWIP